MTRTLSRLLVLVLLVGCASGPKPQEYLVSHILCATEQQANQALSRIRAGEPFDQVARELSIDRRTGKKGGRINQWNTAASWVMEFAEEVERLGVGQVSAKPIETDFGWHILRLDAVR